MCESAALQYSYNLSDSLPRDCSSESQFDIFNKVQNDSFVALEVTDSAQKARSLRSCNMHNSNYTYRRQLEQDVQILRGQLQKEMELHIVLEDAVAHTNRSLSTLPCLPHNVNEVLSTIAGLETTVSKLDEQIISLHLHLNNERVERRLLECHLKHADSTAFSVSSPEDTQEQDTADSGAIIQDKKVSTKNNQQTVVRNVTKKMPIKCTPDHPNQLSEEMVYCMKKIFISLANSSTVSSKSYSRETDSSPSSPRGNHFDSSLWPSSDWSSHSSGMRSPTLDSKFVKNVLAKENTCDPYRVRGKLSWEKVGSYGFATEISWMSVGKKQLEYAAGALKRYRSLVETLAKVNLINLSCNEKLAFWINIYNALIMHAYLAYGVPRNELKRFSLMQKAAYTIGGRFFSAAAIEYGILMMKPPVYRPQTALLLALNKIKLPEEHHKFSVDAIEPLVVFALSCGMYSSPAVRIYTAMNVKQELEDAQRDFIRASVGISSKGRLLVPKMLYCFAKEFVEDSSLAVWISGYLPPNQAAFVEHCMLQRSQRFLSSHNCGILPFDSHFRYLFLPDKLSP